MGALTVERRYSKRIIVSGIPVTTFDPPDVNPVILLSNNNLKATRSSTSSGQWAIGKAKNAMSSGKFYLELTVDNFSGASGTEPLGFGIANANALITTGHYMGETLDSAGFYFNNSSFYLNGNVGISFGATGTTGSVMACYVDLDNKVLFTRNVSSGARNTRGFDMVSLNAGPYKWGVVMSQTNVAGTADFGETAFVGAVPPDFASGWGKTTPDVPCQWSQINHYRNIVSGTRNEIITNDAGIPNSITQRAHATTNKTSGKWYAEFFINNNVGSSRTSVGACFPAMPNNNNMASDAKGTGYFSNGQIYVGLLGLVTTISTYINNDTICMAIDLDNNMAWWRKGSGNWLDNASANPATNTLGIDISSIRVAGYTYGPSWACMPGTGNPGQCTANFGRTSFAQSVPSGFSGWAPLD